MNRHYNNLDAEYEAALAHREAEQLETEMLEDTILQDEELFQRMAGLYARSTLSTGFLDFAVEQLRREREPQHSHAWEDDRETPSKAEYWNWNDDRV